MYTGKLKLLQQNSNKPLKNYCNNNRATKRKLNNTHNLKTVTKVAVTDLYSNILVL